MLTCHVASAGYGVKHLFADAAYDLGGVILRKTLIPDFPNRL
jgi:hypothetical protein